MMTPVPESAADPWVALRTLTAARIALGRAGGSQRTQSVLDFRRAHARARDAVHARFDLDALETQFRHYPLPTQRLATGVSDRPTYLMRPDLGRRLAPASRDALEQLAARWEPRDLAILVSDGHSAQAAERHAAETIARLCELLHANDWTIYPILLIPYGRVKLQDEVGVLLHARHTLMFLGERPGLSAPDSLGAYFTYRPTLAATDADRNCVSNIRPDGLPPAAAAQKLAYLLQESARLGVSGVALKDQQAAVLATPPSTPGLPGY
jgi:ethanolamine ammonia-lyase small subunit